ncbi:hypothetical protein WK56_23850 [Burkholderia ubonensis]|uniref:hypothetical protein n=1 Tax=Burkholderia ubonensis TaxID=101571 RepID=UPI000752B4F3|nr:hypothetical protein [Burkholderia ubonensis]KVT68616.1 hypothetical protein WK56_23850 [Burkholderia ubonensis]
MATTVKEVPGFKVVATGNNIQVNAGPPTQYLVPGIAPYPNKDLVVGNTYNISDPSHQGIVVELVHAPGGGQQTATFRQQT